MKKAMIFGGAVIVGAVLLGQFALKSGRLDWERMIQRMPDAAPPKWMFRNIVAIRENTERILDQLGGERVRSGNEGTGTDA